MTYQLFTDASGKKRTGWAFVLISPDGEMSADNGSIDGLHVNRGELLAVLNGLDAILEPATVEVYTDSVYVIVRMKRKIHRGDLAQRLVAHKSRHNLKFIKVGRDNRPSNHTKAHHLAREAAL